jgi:predicted alpha/beta-hydrolase family hydrolase
MALLKVHHLTGLRLPTVLTASVRREGEVKP